jgi:hypothetical protein
MLSWGKVPKLQINKLPPIRSDRLEQERIKKNKYSSYLDTLKKGKKPKENKPQEVVDQEATGYKRDVTPMPNYYNKWDSFDPDSVMEDIENEKNIGFDRTLNKTGEEITKSSKSDRIYQPTDYDDDALTEEEKHQIEKDKFLKGTSGARPNTQIVVKGGATPSPFSMIESSKKQGNSYFASLEYEKAID